MYVCVSVCLGVCVSLCLCVCVWFCGCVFCVVLCVVLCYIMLCVCGGGRETTKQVRAYRVSPSVTPDKVSEPSLQTMLEHVSDATPMAQEVQSVGQTPSR